MSKLLKTLIKEEITKFNKEQEKYVKHSMLNLGLAITDVQYPDSKVIGLKNKKEIIRNRAEDLVQNLFYAAIDPKEHHSDKELEDFDEKSIQAWYQTGIKNKNLPKDFINLNFPKGREKDINPIIKNAFKLSEKDFELFESHFGEILNKIPYPKERIVLLLISYIAMIEK